MKHIVFVLILSIVMMSFSQCTSTKELQEKAPGDIGQVYCQRWIAGIEGGGSGLNIFIPSSDVSLVLDSVYFRGKAVKLEKDPVVETNYIGRFISKFNQKKDMVMSGDPKAEYGNEMPEIIKKIPFELKENECVISYKEGKKTKYFKVDNVAEKALVPYPSAPKKKQ